MNVSKFLRKDLFSILSIILILCVIDQAYMMKKYGNVAMEVFVLTLFLTSLSMYFGFFKKGQD